MASDPLKYLRESKELQDLLLLQKNQSLDLNDRILKQAEIQLEKEKMVTEALRIQEEVKKGIITITDDEQKELDDILKTQKQINTELTKEQKLRKNIVGSITELGTQLKNGWKFLMEQDKIIKNTILNLGLSGTKAELMRDSFNKSAGFVASLGGNLGDVQSIMEGYADETGRARVLSEEMVKDIAKIGKGTGLGIEQATKLGAQFEYMGFNAKSTMDYVQGIVDTSERMGVNTTKVLKNLNDNFKKLQTFTFTKGSKAMAEMAMNAEKTRVSMSTALDVAEATRNLESVIELGANLQVMGGEFAKMDPFQWLYMARNEPEKMTEKLSEMTRGLYTFKKMADGTFEKFISPEDHDRLASVAKSLGKTNEEMFQIAQRRLDLDKMNQDMAGMGLTKREKELIQGAAFMNKETGKYEVKLAGTMRDITSLTKEEANSFVKETKSLEARAKEALTFEDALKATLNEIKSTLLPILIQINKALAWTREYVLEPLTKLSKSLGPVLTGTGLIAAALIWKTVTASLNHVAQRFVTGGAGLGRSAATAAGNIGGGGGGGSVSGLVEQRRGIGAGARMAGRGKMFAGAGAGIGAAALGIGAGIGVAAVGIGQLADAMSKLDKTQIAALPKVIWALAGAIAAFVIPLAILGTTATIGAAGLAALGLVALGIGAGIGIAAAGIGLMGEGLGKMFESSKGAGKDMLMIAGGIVAIAGALALFNFSGVGLAVFAGVMGAITVASVASAMVANSFAKMGTAMSGTKDDWIAVQNAILAIGSANFKGGGMIADLARLMKSPLKVQFADKDVALNTYVTLDVNGTKFLQAIGTSAHVTYNQKRAQQGKETLQ